MPETNRQILLAARPVGDPKPSDFRLVETPVPEPGEGQILCRALWLSLDPYMRGRMDDAKSYAPAVDLEAVMTGGVVARVVKSKHPNFAEGDLVNGILGWQDYALSDGSDVFRLPRDLPAPPQATLGVLGMPGMTAYVGLLDIGQPKAGETVVVSAASGAVGSVVGQLAKARGCRVVGIAGTAEKCAYVVDDLGFDACVSHRSQALRDDLAAACPDGIDVYFENVGGPVFGAVLPLLNDFARIPVCGLIANYSMTALPDGPDRTPQLFRQILVKRLHIQGFIVFDRAHRHKDFMAEVAPLVADGRIQYRETVLDGLDKAPEGLIGLLKGENFGKLLVRVAD